MTDLPPEVAAAASDPSRRVGRYLRAAKLGAGGMGEVWKAWDAQLLRWVALKLLRGSDDEEIARFKREAQTAAALVHPNIAAIYEVGEDAGRHFIAMQFIEGQTLKTHPRHDRRALVRLLRDAARALAAAHARSVVHRDVKPENLMVAGDRVFVMDFGLARSVRQPSGITVSGMVIGTPAYMSPEQAAGGRADARADVWGLGATLYELLTDRVPFDGDTIVDILTRVAADEPRRPRSIDSRIDRDLETIVLKCLEKDPRRRYAGAGELADDLSHWLDGEPIAARPSTIAYRLYKRIARRPLVWGLGTVASIAVAIAAVVFLGARTTSERLSLAEQANQISGAYYDLSLKTYEPMRALEDYWHGVPRTSDDVDRALAKVREVCDATAHDYPATRLPQAWRALAELMAGRPDALPALEQAVREAGEDPFPRILAARAALARYAREARVGEAEHWDTGMRIRPFTDPPEMRELLARTAGGLARAQELAVWKLLRHGREHLDFAAAGRALAEGDCAGAAARLETLRDHPILGHESLTLRGLALYLLRRYAEAAGAWELTRARRWPDPLAHAALARLCAALTAAPDEKAALMERAESAFAAALELRPDEPIVLVSLSHVHLDRGRDLAARGEDPGHAFASVLDLCGRALRRSPNDVNALITRSMALLLLGDSQHDRGLDPFASYEGAIADLTTVLDASPRRPLALINRGNTRQRMGAAGGGRGRDPLPDYELAIADYDAAIALDPAAREPIFGRGVARILVAARNDTRGADPFEALASAIADLDEVLRRSPDHVPALVHRGRALHDRGEAREERGADPLPDYERALQDLDEAHRLRTPDETALCTRARTLARRAQVRRRDGTDPTEELLRAMEDYAAALRLNPRSYGALVESAGVLRILGEAALAQGRDPAPRFEEAVRRYDEAVRLGAGRAPAYSGRGRVHLVAGDDAALRGRPSAKLYAAALEDFEQALKIEPRDALVLNRRGLAHMGLASHDRAAESFTQALAIRPDCAEYRGNRGLAHWQRGLAVRGRDAQEAYDRAIADLEAVLERGYQEAGTRVNLGLMLLAKGQAEADPTRTYERAIDHFHGAVRRNPKLWQAHANRGLALERLGRLQEAIAAYEAALAINPNVRDVRDRLDDARRRAGKE